MNTRAIIIGAAVVAVVVIGALVSKGKHTVVRQDNAVAVKTSSKDDVSAKQMDAMAKSYEDKGDDLQARDMYRKIIAQHPDYSEIESVQHSLEKVSMDIIFSKRETPQTTIHEVVPGDSLGKLARKYHTTIDLIKKSNGLTSNTIRVGDRLRIWKGTFSVLVDKSQNKLILKSDGDVVKVYDVSTGKDNSTPVGTFTIVNKLVDPVWYKSGAIVPPESPQNALGARWMGLSIPGYGIHGTIDPQSIGQQMTAGCVRMRNEDVKQLYSILPVGTKVTVVN